MTVIDDVDEDEGEYGYQYPVRGRRGAKKKGFLKEDCKHLLTNAIHSVQDDARFRGDIRAQR